MAEIKAECFEDKKVPGQWRVEWVGEDDECYVTIFSGPSAQHRAEDYQKHAQWLINESEVC